MNSTDNMKIDHTQLGPEDHGILTAFVHLRKGSIGCGFGGLDLRAEGEAQRFIEGVLKVVGVRKWEDLPGKYVRARLEGRRLVAIGHITDDKWFNLLPTEDTTEEPA